MVFTFLLLWLSPLIQEKEKKSESVYLKEKMVWEKGSEEQLDNESTIFKQVNIKQTSIFILFFFVYNSQLNYTCLSNVLFKWAISL